MTEEQEEDITHGYPFDPSTGESFPGVEEEDVGQMEYLMTGTEDAVEETLVASEWFDQAADRPENVQGFKPTVYREEHGDSTIVHFYRQEPFDEFWVHYVGHDQLTLFILRLYNREELP